eukprot:3848049-Rhodomonas_salina.1
MRWGIGTYLIALAPTRPEQGARHHVIPTCPSPSLPVALYYFCQALPGICSGSGSADHDPLRVSGLGSHSSDSTHSVVNRYLQKRFSGSTDYPPEKSRVPVLLSETVTNADMTYCEA